MSVRPESHRSRRAKEPQQLLTIRAFLILLCASGCAVAVVVNPVAALAIGIFATVLNLLHRVLE